jgi:hypothetical protein
MDPTTMNPAVRKTSIFCPGLPKHYDAYRYFGTLIVGFPGCG